MTVRYVAIEGPDGVGKSTIINKLVSYFNTNTSYTAKVFSPCNNEYGLAIKQLLKEKGTIIPPVVEANLHMSTLQNTLVEIEEFVSNWIDDNRKNISQSIKSGKDYGLIIFIDRWIPSTMVYQIDEHNLNPDIVKNIDNLYNVPRIFTIYLDAKDEVLDKRLYNRDPSELEHYEDYDLQKRIRERYRQRINYIGHHKAVDVSDDDVDKNVKKILSEIIFYL